MPTQLYSSRCRIQDGSVVASLLLSICSICVLVGPACFALDNGQALTPPMGWLSWERFRCNINCSTDPDNCIREELFSVPADRQMADRMALDGFLDAGYNVLGIDDCWLAKERDPDGRLQPDALRFPSGIKDLAAYVHDRQLQFGIYEDIGSKTCGGYPGMARNLELDAQTFSAWGIDYLKVDGCYAETQDLTDLYTCLGEYLNATGRPITYSCSWPAYLPDPVQTGFQVPYHDLQKHCNLWRNWVDIQDSWASLASIIVFWAEASEASEGFTEVARPGAFNDPDMLIIGNEALTRAQGEVQMAMWAIFAAPLLMSVDLRNLSSWARDILLDKDAISINQDPLGKQGRLLRCVGGCTRAQLWQRDLMEGKRAIAFLNLSDSPTGRLCADLDKKLTGARRVFRRLTMDLVDSKLCIASLDATSVALFLLLPAKNGQGVAMQTIKT